MAAVVFVRRFREIRDPRWQEFTDAMLVAALAWAQDWPAAVAQVRVMTTEASTLRQFATTNINCYRKK